MCNGFDWIATITCDDGWSSAGVREGAGKRYPSRSVSSTLKERERERVGDGHRVDATHHQGYDEKCLILPTRIVGMRYVSSFEMKNMYSFTRDKILSI